MNTKLLKQRILDLAIHGRLVPQNPDDEPASQLLRRISEEKEKLIAQGKIKRPKKSDAPNSAQEFPFEIPDNWNWINLEDFVLGPDKNKSIYDLYGVVTHLGESGASGHFVAACKSPCKDNRWYRFNDAIVTPINNIQSDIINFGMPYILFYKKRE